MGWQAHTSVDLSHIKCSVTIVSDSLFHGMEMKTEDPKNDESGPLALEMLAEEGVGHTNIDYLPDEYAAIKAKIEEEAVKGTDLVIFIGGTGLSKRDVTTDAIEQVIDKTIYGFGEEFRRHSIEEIGPFGMISRAIAGVYKRALIVGIPGSPNAAETGLKILLPIVGHTLQQLRKE